MFAKVLFDQFTAEKAANGWVKRAITGGFADREPGKLASRTSALQCDGQDKASMGL